MSALAEHTVADQDDFQDEELASFIDVEELAKLGVNQADITKLKQAGITTVRGVQMTTTRALLKIKGFSEAKCEKIKQSANQMQASGFVTATEMTQRRAQVLRISTGSKELDKLLGGGIQTMSITEAFGEFRCGKTQLSHTLSVTCQLPVEMGGANGKVAFIDTEGTFRPERIEQIAKRFGVDPEMAKENILVAKCLNSEHQLDLINELAHHFAEEKGAYRLLIVDSVIALFRTEFMGRGELADRQQRLGVMLARLNNLSQEFNVAVFITNQMCSDPGAGMSFVPDPKKPVGGHVLAHASQTRLSLRKGRGDQRVAKMYDSPEMPEAEAVYAIGQGGIIDATD